MTQTKEKKLQNRKQFIFFLSILIGIVSFISIFTACSPCLSLDIQPTGETKITWDSTMSPTTLTVLQRFTGTELVFFRLNDIQNTLKASNITSETITSPSADALLIQAKAQNIANLPIKNLNFDKQKRTFSITFSQEMLTESLLLLPSDVIDYLDLLMAPVFTGEESSPDEYKALISSAYGKTLGTELAAAHFIISFTAPDNITKADITKPGSFIKTGRTAQFSIPLTSLLTLEKPIILSASW